MRSTLLLAAIALSGCASDEVGWTRVESEARYAPTDASTVEVLHRMPDDAEVLGQVHGVHWKISAIDDARRRAAEIGAHAIIPRTTGDEAPEYPFFPFTTDFVEATAVRLSKQ